MNAVDRSSGSGGRRRSRRSGGQRAVASTVAALVAAAWIVDTGAPVEAATSVVALYQMNEAAGSRVMADSGPFGLNGTIGTDIQVGATFAGATGYRWSNVSPTAPPAKPERIAYVPTNNNLNPGSGDYTVEFRYRTTRSFGNVVQKGQNATPGGYFKFEQPNGNMTCLFKGGNGQQRAIVSPIKTNDGNWHTIRCERTSTYIRLVIDGVQVGRLNGPTGTIANSERLSIGGKSKCDQIRVTCDYFVGDIDYVKIEKQGTAPPPPPSNQPPAASFTASCTDLTCTFDSSGSSDADGTIVQRNWTFGDGTTASGSSVQHTYAAAGTYTVGLTVIDDDGAAGQSQRTVTPGQQATTISYVGGTTRSANATTHSTTLPAVQAGDGMLLFVTVGSPVTVGNPAGVGGWTQVGTESSGSYGSTTVWKKVAAAGDAGDTVRVTLSSAAKGNISVVAYRATSTSDPVAAFASRLHTSGSSRTTPVVDVTTGGAWAVSYWAHRDSSSTSLSVPAGTVSRLAASQSGGGRITSLLADSGGPAPTGSYGGLTATAQSSSSFGTAFTVVLGAG